MAWAFGAACAAPAQTAVPAPHFDGAQQAAAALASLPPSTDVATDEAAGRASVRLEAWPLGDADATRLHHGGALSFAVDTSQPAPWRIVLGLTERPAPVLAVHVCVESNVTLAIEVSTYPAATRVDRASWPQFLRNAVASGHLADLATGCQWLQLPEPTLARYVILGFSPASEASASVQIGDAAVWVGASDALCDDARCRRLEAGALVPLPSHEVP